MALDPETAVRTTLRDAGLAGRTVLVACSGGCDSVALAGLVAGLRGDLALDVRLAHLDHGLRGEASAGDAEFVRELGGRLDVPVVVERADVAAASAASGRGIEEAARELRYHFLASAAAACTAPAVLTAHTADDQVETILFRIVRGTGLGGLSGIPIRRQIAPGIEVVRPLLRVWRRDLDRWLEGRGWRYRSDETNRDTQFARNRIRERLLPMLRRDFNRHVDEALVRLGQLAGECETLVQETLASVSDRAVRARHPDRLVLDLAALAPLSPYLVRELVRALWDRQGWPRRELGFRDLEQVEAMVRGETPSAQFAQGVRAAVKDGTLVLSRETPVPAGGEGPE